MFNDRSMLIRRGNRPEDASLTGILSGIMAVDELAFRASGSFGLMRNGSAPSTGSELSADLNIADCAKSFVASAGFVGF